MNSNDMNFSVTVPDSITCVRSALSDGVAEIFNWNEKMCSLKSLHIRHSLRE